MLFRSLVVFLFFASVSRAESPSQDALSLKVKLGSVRAELYKTRVFEVDDWVFSFDESSFILQSAASRVAATTKARLGAINNIQRKVIRDNLKSEIENQPILLRDTLYKIFELNYSGVINLSAVQTLETREVDDSVEVYIAVRKSNISSIGMPSSLKESLERLVRSEKNPISSIESDVFYEACLRIGLSDARKAWIRSNPELIRSQLKGESVNRAIRSWHENMDKISPLTPDLSSASEIKNAMIVLPYNKELIERLAITLTSNGLTRVADDVLSIKPAISISDLDFHSNPDILQEFNSSGLANNIAVKVVIAAQGEFPSAEEPATAAYEVALSAYKKGDITNALPLCVAAFSEAHNSDTINLLGATLRRSGFYTLGALLCRQAEFMNPAHPYAAVNTALGYELAGQMDMAALFARKAIDNSNADKWAKSEANRILLK